MHQRASAVGILLALVAMLVPTAAGATPRDVADTCGDAPPAGFADVRKHNVHAAMIDCIRDRDITHGKTADTYDPAGALTRQQIASFLSRTLTAGGQALPATSRDYFDDDGGVHEDNINRLAAAGIVDTSTRRFGPLTVVTRAEMSRLTAAMLQHAGVLPSGGFVPDRFTDDDGSPDEDAINLLVDAGILSGHVDGSFRPDENLRRDQMATFLGRSIDLLLDGLGSHDHCQIHSVAERFDRSWYTQQCEVMGLAIIAADNVPAAALSAAGQVLRGMLGTRPDVARYLADHDLYVALVAQSDGITDLPEYRYMKDDPETDWDERARGFGGTDLASGAEENVLCYDSDNDDYHGESILLHEFAHSLLEAGLEPLDPTFRERLDTAYEHARAAGRWDNTYAAEDVHEYWAEGVQIYFDANLTSSPPDGIHGPIGTRAQLASYDSELFELIDEAFRASPWTYACP